MSVFNRLRWQRILVRLFGDLKPLMFHETIFMYSHVKEGYGSGVVDDIEDWEALLR